MSIPILDIDHADAPSGPPPATREALRRDLLRATRWAAICRRHLADVERHSDATQADIDRARRDVAEAEGDYYAAAKAAASFI